MKDSSYSSKSQPAGKILATSRQLDYAAKLAGDVGYMRLGHAVRLKFGSEKTLTKAEASVLIDWLKEQVE